jgi:hypothetical protein
MEDDDDGGGGDYYYVLTHVQNQLQEQHRQIKIISRIIYQF